MLPYCLIKQNEKWGNENLNTYKIEPGKNPHYIFKLKSHIEAVQAQLHHKIKSQHNPYCNAPNI
jgi:hypothetical protein